MSDVDRYQYGYDQNSNRLYKANVVGTPVVAGGLDEHYTYDSLNCLTVMQRGTLNSGKTGITGTPVREMDYTLDPTGNWAAYVTKTNGATDLSQTRSANTVNEITAIGGTPGWATPPAYDAAGNMTSFPQPASPASSFTAVYDAWDRMVSINTSGGSVATYQYDGRGRRIVKYTASISETRHFYYSNNWEDIEERTGSSTSMDKQYIWGRRYIDELVCRDDATPERLYAMQDANFNLTSVSNTSGGVVERYLFDPYGNRTIMNGSWGVISSSAYNWVIGHQGLMDDVESGLLYNRARYLSARLGTFLNRDPNLYVDGKNLYLYEKSSPTHFLDPYGKCTECCVDELSFDPKEVKATPDGGDGGIHGVTFKVKFKWHIKDDKTQSDTAPCRFLWYEWGTDAITHSDGSPGSIPSNTWTRIDNRDDAKDMFKNLINADFTKDGELTIQDAPGGGDRDTTHIRYWAIKATSSCRGGGSKIIYGKLTYSYGAGGTVGKFEQIDKIDKSSPPDAYGPGVPPGF